MRHKRQKNIKKKEANYLGNVSGKKQKNNSLEVYNEFPVSPKSEQGNRKTRKTVASSTTFLLMDMKNNYKLFVSPSLGRIKWEPTKKI